MSALANALVGNLLPPGALALDGSAGFGAVAGAGAGANPAAIIDPNVVTDVPAAATSPADPFAALFGFTLLDLAGKNPAAEIAEPAAGQHAVTIGEAGSRKTRPTSASRETKADDETPAITGAPQDSTSAANALMAVLTSMAALQPVVSAPPKVSVVDPDTAGTTEPVAPGDSTAAPAKASSENPVPGIADPIQALLPPAGDDGIGCILRQATTPAQDTTGTPQPPLPLSSDPVPALREAQTSTVQNVSRKEEDDDSNEMFEMDPPALPEPPPLAIAAHRAAVNPNPPAPPVPQAPPTITEAQKVSSADADSGRARNTNTVEPAVSSAPQPTGDVSFAVRLQDRPRLPAVTNVPPRAPSNAKPIQDIVPEHLAQPVMEAPVVTESEAPKDESSIQVDAPVSAEVEKAAVPLAAEPAVRSRVPSAGPETPHSPHATPHAVGKESAASTNATPGTETHAGNSEDNAGGHHSNDRMPAAAPEKSKPAAEYAKAMTETSPAAAHMHAGTGAENSLAARDTAAKHTPSDSSRGPASSTILDANTTTTETPRTGSTQQLQLRLGDNSQSSVSLSVMDRGGQIHVSVRTPNAEISADLRRDLQQLVQRLEQTGFVPETWTPTSDGNSSFENRDRNPANPDSQQQSQQQQQQQRQDGLAYSSRQGQGQGRRPGWMDVFENLHGNV